VIVLGTGVDHRRLNLARELGAVTAIDVGEEDPAPIVRGLTGGWGADIVFECSGAGPAALGLLEHVRRGGQYAQIGLFGRPVAWDLDQVCLKELRVTGSNASVPSAWRTALRLLGEGRVQTAPLISDVCSLAGWEEAFHRFERRDGVKILLDPWSAPASISG
jgi:L-iditol 2-dehydrogenase